MSQTSASLDLNATPPYAGELRPFPLGEALFFSPKPLPSAMDSSALGPSGEVLEINDVYMDIGGTSHGTAFQVQLLAGFISFFLFVQMATSLLIARRDYIINDGQASLWHYFVESVIEGLPFTIIAASVALCLGGYAIISTSLKAARQRPLRFNRQRREVCYYPEGSKQPQFIPWEEVVSWVAMHKGATGTNVMTNVTFGMALPHGDNYWVLTRPVATVASAQLSWETMRCYMDEAPEYWASAAQPEDRRSFDEHRKLLHEHFKIGPKNLFWMEWGLHSTSYAGMVWFYLANVFCLWKFPYWVSEWSQNLATFKPTEALEAWSQPLPENEWAQPSAELVRLKAEITAHYQAGGSLGDFVKPAA
ncbi:hypothetical protein [Shewanella algae]|uniref:hypothetical protein n=1 Tax=Shewanella algae TaxID=38313 RepID=UPI0031F58E41